ncbi:hypothetical protein EI94DRAFT_72849 [Lactarius quietus]|nr:hypothetical protein EI94DRAFT_72849 [Lactarius quietus]
MILYVMRRSDNLVILGIICVSYLQYLAMVHHIRTTWNQIPTLVNDNHFIHLQLPSRCPHPHPTSVTSDCTPSPSEQVSHDPTRPRHYCPFPRLHSSFCAVHAPSVRG